MTPDDGDVILPTRTFRVERDIWDAAMVKAHSENFTLSQVLRRFLVDYVAEGQK